MSRIVEQILKVVDIEYSEVDKAQFMTEDYRSGYTDGLNFIRSYLNGESEEYEPLVDSYTYDDEEVDMCFEELPNIYIE